MSNFALPMQLPNFNIALKDAKSEFAPARLAAAVALSLAEDHQMEQAVDTLCVLLDDSLEEICVQALDALASLVERGGKVDSVYIEPFLRDERVSIRSTAVELMHFFFASPLDVALQASVDDSADVRLAAASQLGRIEHSAAVVRLIALVDDPSFPVRCMAAIQLKDHMTEEARALLEFIIPQKGEFAAEAMFALMHTPATERTMKILREIAYGRTTALELRAIAAGVLVECNDADGITLATNFLRSWRKSRRLVMIQVLSQLRSHCAISLLQDFVSAQKSPKDDEFSAAIQALGTCAIKNGEAFHVLQSLRGQIRPSLRAELEDTLIHLEKSQYDSHPLSTI